jgi:BlaI family transcriptional regulator, penicillinase repressor
MPVALSDRELDVMRAVWDLGEVTVAEVQRALRTRRVRLARTTVATLLDRLEAKGAVRQVEGTRRPVRRYEAVTAREVAGTSALSRLVETIFGGMPGLAMTHLVGDARLTGEELYALRRLLDERLAAHRRKRRRSR